MIKNQRLYSKTHTLQLDQSDCGVACLSSIIKYYGGEISLEKLRELSGTTSQGTTLLGLYQAANQLGFKAQGNELDIKTLVDLKKPLILHVEIQDNIQHYLVCYEYKNNKFIIGDPARGIVNYTKKEVEKIWKSKTCLTLSPTSKLKHMVNSKKSKKGWLLNLLKEDYHLLSISVIIGIAIGFLGMSMSIYSQKLIDDILPSQNTQQLIISIVILTLLLFARVGLSALREFLLISQTKDFNNRIIDKFYDSLLYLPKPFFDTREISELVARLNDTNRIQKVIKHVANNFVIDGLIVIISLGFLLRYSWEIGLIALLSLPIYFIIIYRFNKKIIAAQKDVMQSYAYSESNYISTMNGIAEIKNFNKQSIFKKINQYIYGNFQSKIFNLSKINIRLSLLSGILSVIFVIYILSIAAFEVYQKIMTLGELMAILGIIGLIIPSITNLALIAIPINEAKIALNRMFEFATSEKEKAGRISIKKFEFIELKDISFRFAGRKPLLRSVNIKVKKGRLVAIIGESGCGKSTISQILQKFYIYKKGNIIVNNEFELEDILTKDWRNIIGVIPQEIYIFSGNIIDNILVDIEDTSENVAEFCQKYGFDQFISKFPQGYLTQVGDQGVNLSGGQKQIIALARALYKNPQFLILDEPTSAMDRNTEKFTLKLLSELKKNMAILLITHRLQSLKKNFNTIYILENGKISVKGSHTKLLKTDNFYSNFWKEIEI